MRDPRSGIRVPSKIAFVILTWNSERYIAECLESISRISNYVCDVHVVDNGSTDSTLAVIQNLEMPSLTLYQQSENIGTTRSRNIALRNIGRDVDYV